MHPLKTGSVLQFCSCNPAESNSTAPSVIPGKKTQIHLIRAGGKEGECCYYRLKSPCCGGESYKIYYNFPSGLRKVGHETSHLCTVKYCSLRNNFSTQYFYQAHNCNLNKTQVDTCSFCNQGNQNIRCLDYGAPQSFTAVRR